MVGGMLGVACMAREMATAADSMHPTGMHSCLIGKQTCPHYFCVKSKVLVFIMENKNI